MPLAAMIAMQRSGTHALGSVIDQHPDITYANEVFHPDSHKVRFSYFDFLTDLCSEAPELLMPWNAKKRFERYQAYIEERDEKKITLIDVKYSSTHHLNPEWHPLTRPPFLINLLAHHNVPVIHLRRRNLVRGAMSMLMSEATGLFNTQTPDRLQKQRIQVKPEILLNRIKFLQTEVGAMTHMLQNYPKLLTLEYTDLFENNALRPAIAHKIESHLGVSPMTHFEPTYLKQARRPLQETVVNFDEIAEALKPTPYASMLFEP